MGAKRKKKKKTGPASSNALNKLRVQVLLADCGVGKGAIGSKVPISRSRS